MGNCEDIRKGHRGWQSARDRAFDLSDLVQVRMKNWHCEGSPPSKPMFLMMIIVRVKSLTNQVARLRTG